MTEFELRAQVLLDPASDTARDVYADLLDDTAGDDQAQRVRAAFIRVQLELARTPPLPPTLGGTFHGSVPDRSHCLRFEATVAGWQKMVNELARDGTPPENPRTFLATGYRGELIHVTSRNAAGGEMHVWGHVLDIEMDVRTQTVEIVLRACERPAWCVRRFQLEQQEGRLYDAGGAACWPDLRPEPKRDSGVSTIGVNLRAAFAARARNDRDDALTDVVNRAVERELARSGVGLPEGFIREAAALYEGSSQAMLRPYLDTIPKTLPDVRFERGFVHTVRATEAEFLREAGHWFAHQPIRHVHIKNHGPTVLQVGSGTFLGWHRGPIPGRSAYHGGEVDPKLFRLLRESDFVVRTPNFLGIDHGPGRPQARQELEGFLARACRRYGRGQARQYELRADPCPACAGAGCKQHAHQHGLRRLRCDGSGQVRSQGLPYYPEDV